MKFKHKGGELVKVRGKITRREFVKKSAAGILITGGLLALWRTFVSPYDRSMGCPDLKSPYWKPKIPAYNKKALFFDEHHYALVATLAAIIIPSDEYPGATEAGVVDFIDKLLAESDANKQKEYSRGLAWIDEASRETYGGASDFLALDVEDQIGLLRRIDEITAVRSKPVRGFLGRLSRKIRNTWFDTFGVMDKRVRFLERLRRDVIMGFYTNPLSWMEIGYFGPPQPVGYLGFADPPSPAAYTGAVRPVQNDSCLGCHSEGKHPRGGLINHTCIACHKPHAPWTYDKNAFHLEDHIELAFPNPDRQGKEKKW